MPGRPARVLIGGVPVDRCSAGEFVGLTTRWATDGGKRTVVGVNAHVVNVAATNPSFAAALGASDLNLADGQSIVWAARLLGHRLPGRVPLTHLTSELCAAWAAADLPVYLLGGRPGIASRAAERLHAAYGTRVVGAAPGYFDDADPAIVAAINASGARIVLVGLGNPRQELWTHANRAQLAAGVVLTCGGWPDASVPTDDW
jgi:N-acetylglucosaminyldiphosphoundecaprenol N-acetyl-beta-D-mannosaminyltransferase